MRYSTAADNFQVSHTAGTTVAGVMCETDFLAIPDGNSPALTGTVRRRWRNYVVV